MYRRLFSIMLALMMVMTMSPFALAEDGSSDPSGESRAASDLEAFEALGEDDYEPGEVIVLFKEGAVKDKEMSLSAARKVRQIDRSFGDAMDASGEAEKAADNVRSEVSIIEESLGGDFVIKDSIALDEDMVVCLVSSDKYDTEDLIRLLSGNDKIKSVEANTYLEPKSYDYSLDDALNQYVYPANSPADNNTGGDNVNGRGTAPEQAVSMKTGAVSDFGADHSSTKEVVVAVIDSGINEKHEDLKNMLWTNPGDIGLEGVHGFNFDDNATDLTDWVGHGTHCSGIIAAQANNGKGVAGVASGVNVKIMMCSISSGIVDEEGRAVHSDKPTSFRRIGAMNYVLKAKQRGVNVVATSNSWGSPDKSDVFDDAINKLGEAGIVTFVAASNESTNIDEVHYSPAGGDSKYMVTVGSVDITGKPSGFSNYGKTYVDLFAPGHNILSTSAFSIYSPSFYSAEERAANTEYYGAFNSSVEVSAEVDEELGTNRVVPATDLEEAFGPAKFFKQKKDEGGGDDDEPVDPDGETTDPDGGTTDPDGGDTSGEGGEVTDPDGEDTPEATCELSISEDKFFTDSSKIGTEGRPASLKVTIHNARVGEEYYLYFPYKKNKDTKGISNTRYSVTTIFQHKKEEFTASIAGGEIIKHEKDGKVYCSSEKAGEMECSSQVDDGVENFTCGGKDHNDKALLSWDEVDPDNPDVDVIETGLGISISATSTNDPAIEDDAIGEDEIRDITVYIDSLGISKPVTEEGKTPEDVFSANSSYEIMSGTSMATPAAAGAYAVLATLYPQKEGQTGSEYAIENRARLFSSVRKSESLKDLCSTGGYIDLSMLGDNSAKTSIHDAVCDVKAGTLTLHGIGLTDDLKLSCRSLAKTEAEEEQLPSGNMKISVAKDGKTMTISGAKDLFGRYIEFILRDGENVRARGAFFTVKGQTALNKIYTEEFKDSYGENAVNVPPRELLTDSTGKDLYAYQMNSYSLYEKTAGVLHKYDGSKFVQYPGTKLHDALFDYYEKELGYDMNEISRGLEIQYQIVKHPIYENNVIYDFVATEYTPYLDAPEEKIERKTFLASLNYTAKAPAWKFTEIQFIEDVYDDPESLNTNQLAYCMMGGKIYCFGTPVDVAEEITDEDNFTFAYALDVKTGKWERKADLKGASIRNADAFYNNGKIWLMFGSQGDKPSNEVYSFDGTAWKKVAEIPFVGRAAARKASVSGSVAPVKDGFILVDYSVDGAGNVSLLNTTTGKISPMYYTLGTGLSDPEVSEGGNSAIEAEDGIYYIMLTSDSGQMYRTEMYKIPKTSYSYTPRYKSVNPAKITKKNLKVKAKTLKKKSAKKTAVTVKKAKGAVTYKLAKIKCSKKLLKTAKKKIKINKKTGKVTLAKGLKKGKYTVSVKVSAKGDKVYKALTKTVTFKITVK